MGDAMSAREVECQYDEPDEEILAAMRSDVIITRG